MEISEGFHIHALTNGKFNCSEFDRLFYASKEVNSEQPEWYSCSANVPSSPRGNDLATHSKPPMAKDEETSLGPASKAVVIFVTLVIGLGIVSFLIRCGCKRIEAAREIMSEEEGSIRSSMTTSDRRTEARTDRTEVRASEDLDRHSEEKLPPYRRRGQLGEVPPAYPHGDAPGYEDVMRIDSSEITEVPPAVLRRQIISDELEMPPSLRLPMLRNMS